MKVILFDPGNTLDLDPVPLVRDFTEAIGSTGESGQSGDDTLT
jgi:hypothetical protein